MADRRYTAEMCECGDAFCAGCYEPESAGRDYDGPVDTGYAFGMTIDELDRAEAEYERLLDETRNLEAQEAFQ